MRICELASDLLVAAKCYARLRATESATAPHRLDTRLRISLVKNWTEQMEMAKTLRPLLQCSERRKKKVKLHGVFVLPVEVH